MSIISCFLLSAISNSLLLLKTFSMNKEHKDSRFISFLVSTVAMQASMQAFQTSCFRLTTPIVANKWAHDATNSLSSLCLHDIVNAYLTISCSWPSIASGRTVLKCGGQILWCVSESIFCRKPVEFDLR